MKNLLLRDYEIDRALAYEEKRTRDRVAKIAAMPRVRFSYGRDWEYGVGKMIGVYWGKNPNAGEGELIYQKWITFRWSFRFDVSTK